VGVLPDESEIKVINGLSMRVGAGQDFLNSGASMRIIVPPEKMVKK
jgi:hypothetical protein